MLFRSMRQVKKHILSILVLTALVGLLAGCGGPKHLLVETPQTVLQANKMVADGESMVTKGDNMVNEGESCKSVVEK